MPDFHYQLGPAWQPAGPFMGRVNSSPQRCWLEKLLPRWTPSTPGGQKKPSGLKNKSLTHMHTPLPTPKQISRKGQMVMPPPQKSCLCCTGQRTHVTGGSDSSQQPITHLFLSAWKLTWKPLGGDSCPNQGYCRNNALSILPRSPMGS